ncbi:MAG: CHAT domain-containing protein, partial [Candidatus Eremiobacterota bacterium]
QSFYYETGLKYGHLGRVYEQKGDKEKALTCLNRALKIAKETGNKQLTALAYTNLGKFFFNQKQYEDSLGFYMKAINIAEEINSINRLTYYTKTGDIYEQTGQQEKALHFYLKSIEVIEGIRNEMKVEEFKRDFMKDNIKTYEKAIDIFMKLGRYEEGFNCNEQARARTFLDIIANQKVDITHGIDPELAGKEEELSRRIQYLSGYIRKEKEDGAKKISSIKSKENELKSLKSEYEQILKEIKLKNPEYASLISVNPLCLKDIRQIPDKDSVIIEYFLGKKRSYIWITDKDLFKTITIACNEEEIKKSIIQYREDNCEHMTGEKLKNNKWQDEGKKLYAILFKDVDKYVKEKKRLFIVPHSSLYYLPFQLLIDDEGKTLLEKYEISYAPSASVFKYCENKNRLAKNKLIAFEPGDLAIDGFSPLPGTDREVNSICKFFSEKEIYKGKDMTTEVLYKKGREFDILHFATHATLEPVSPVFSSLIFSDKTLPVYEIFNLDLNAYLVTLSACKTGIGEGDELVGLSRAFIYAGTPTICASLWDVSDIATSELMEKFYYYLKNHTKSEALKLAQMDIMKKYSHPFFWAPFILTGDWR